MDEIDAKEKEEVVINDDSDGSLWFYFPFNNSEYSVGR